jgi:lipoyl(octanoyl) transferase
MSVAADKLALRTLGRRTYGPVWRAMQAFTETRDADTADELWAVEHPPVYTLGRNARPEHLLAPGTIPVVQVDRGGQVTYHGPGQAVLYTLVDLRRRGQGVRWLVSALEAAVIDLLAEYGIAAAARPDAPGVYVDGAKIASLGLRVRRGCAYHGVSLNVSMDLTPFAGINPCGYPGLAVTELRAFGVETQVETVLPLLAEGVARRLGHRGCRFLSDNVDAAADTNLECVQ